jgi:hypothetical protein
MFNQCMRERIVGWAKRQKHWGEIMAAPWFEQGPRVEFVLFQRVISARVHYYTMLLVCLHFEPGWVREKNSGMSKSHTYVSQSSTLSRTRTSGGMQFSLLQETPMCNVTPHCFHCFIFDLTEWGGNVGRTKNKRENQGKAAPWVKQDLRLNRVFWGKKHPCALLHHTAFISSLWTDSLRSVTS